MSRVSLIRIIDGLIENIQTITKSQCSLSEQDLNVLEDVLKVLRDLKEKKGKTYEQVLKEVAVVVEMITKFFI